MPQEIDVCDLCGIRADTEHPCRRRRAKCRQCAKEHCNYHSDSAHGTCSSCRDAELQRVRDTGRCCRCGRFVAPLTACDGERDRFLACATCGLVLTRDPSDTVRAVRP